MRAHTNSFKQNISRLGREIDVKINYSYNGEQIELGSEQINSVSLHYEGSILKSVMKQLDIDSNVRIPVGVRISFQLGVKVANQYEYINYGYYSIKEEKKQEDTNSWAITCYDKMLYTMKDYEAMNITYPITIRNYLTAICNHLRLTFKNTNDTFVNYDKVIEKELYLSDTGNSLNYTFRDVLDDIAEATASTICMTDDDKLEIRYLNETNEIIDEEFLKDTNINIGNINGPINTIILSRSSEADKISLSNPVDLPDEQKIAIEIVDNEIMNDNDRADYLAAILTQLNGSTYYSNDVASYGVCYLDLCDLYNIKIGNNLYQCIMLNNEININNGLEELIYTDDKTISNEDYKHIGADDRKVDQAYILVKKNEGTIESLVSRVGSVETKEGNDYQELLGKFQAVDDAIVDIDDYKTIVRQLQTDTYTKTEVQQIANGTGVDGVKVSAVITTSGTFDEDGMTYEKTNAPTKSTINEIGLNVKNQNNSSVLFAGYIDGNSAPQDLLNKYGDYKNQTIVGTDNIIVNNYLNIGTHSRMQDYGNGTGIFWR